MVKTFDVTIPEGLSIRESAKAINDSGVKGDYRKAVKSDEAIRRARQLGLPKSADTLEGFLFPATYQLEVGATADDLVDQAARRVRGQHGQAQPERAQRKNLDEYDVVTIASLIERETPSDKERPLVSSVIYNRLAQDEPLGIDATTRYYEKKWDGSTARVRAGGRQPVQHAAQRRPAADADRGARPRLAEGGGQAGEHRLPLLHGQAGRVPRVRGDARGARGERRGVPGGVRRGQGAAAEVLTTYLGVAGWPVAHSRSPVMHDAALAAAGLRGWRYLKLPLPPERFAETVRRAARGGLPRDQRHHPAQGGGARAGDGGHGRRGRGGGGEHAHLRVRRGGARRQHRRPRPARGAAGGPGGDGRDRARRRRRGARGRPCPAQRRSAADMQVWNRTPARAERLAAELGGRPCRRTGTRHGDRQLHQHRPASGRQAVQEPAVGRRYVGRRKLRGRHGLQARVARLSSPKQGGGARPW